MAPGPAFAVKLEARLRTILTACAIALGVVAVALGAGYVVSLPVTLKLAVPSYDTASRKLFEAAAEQFRAQRQPLRLEIVSGSRSCGSARRRRARPRRSRRRPRRGGAARQGADRPDRPPGGRGDHGGQDQQGEEVRRHRRRQCRRRPGRTGERQRAQGGAGLLRRSIRASSRSRRCRPATSARVPRRAHRCADRGRQSDVQGRGRRRRRRQQQRQGRHPLSSRSRPPRPSPSAFRNWIPSSSSKALFGGRPPQPPEEIAGGGLLDPSRRQRADERRPHVGPAPAAARHPPKPRRGRCRARAWSSFPSKDDEIDLRHSPRRAELWRRRAEDLLRSLQRLDLHRHDGRERHRLGDRRPVRLVRHPAPPAHDVARVRDRETDRERRGSETGSALDELRGRSTSFSARRCAKPSTARWIKPDSRPSSWRSTKPVRASSGGGTNWPASRRMAPNEAARMAERGSASTIIPSRFRRPARLPPRPPRPANGYAATRGKGTSKSPSPGWCPAPPIATAGTAPNSAAITPARKSPS